MGTSSVHAPLLSAKSLSVNRAGRSVLNNIHLEIHTGAGPFAIIGESGSGKTTLLYCVTGLMPFTEGEITVSGQLVQSMSPTERARHVGLVFQDYQLFPHLSVRENIELAPRLEKGINSKLGLTDSLLKSLHIEELAARMPHELSGGQKQRVAIARSLILEPSILFLDEPSAALDEKTTLELAVLLKELNHRVQIVVVSHDRIFVEACCDRGIRIHEGMASEALTISSLFNREESKD